MHVLITGASAGLGEGFARRFGANGWKLSLVARREERLRSLDDELASECFVRPADLSDPAVAEAVYQDCVDAFGPVDVLVNNAGVQYVEPTAGVDVARIQRMMNINVVTPLAFIHVALRQMLERGDGTIVNVASMAAITHTPGMCHYNGSKAALAASSESLRVELKGTGVHVVTVYPGPVESDMEAAGRAAYRDTFFRDAVPTGTPERLAALVERAILGKKARVIYPQAYTIARHTRNVAQAFTDLFAPPLAVVETGDDDQSVGEPHD